MDHSDYRLIGNEIRRGSNRDPSPAGHEWGVRGTCLVCFHVGDFCCDIYRRDWKGAANTKLGRKADIPLCCVCNENVLYKWMELFIYFP